MAVTLFLIIIVALFGALGWTGRRPRQHYYPDQTIERDADLVCGDGDIACCDDCCGDGCGSDDAPATGDRDD